MAANAPAPQQAQAKQWQESDDLWLNFEAQPTLLPPAVEKLPEDQEKAVNLLASLFMAVPWGSQLPAVHFSALGLPPSMVHTLVGDTMWQECWGERHNRVNSCNMVPYKLLNLLKYVTEQPKLQLGTDELERGQDRYEAVQLEAKRRRKLGSSY